MAAMVVGAGPDRYESSTCAHPTPPTRPTTVVGVAGYYGWTWPPPADVVNSRSLVFFGGTPTGSAQPAWRTATAFAHLDDGPATTLVVGERDNLCTGTLDYAAALVEHQRSVRVVVAPYAGDQTMISPRTLEGQLTVRETLAALRASPSPWTADRLGRPRSVSDRIDSRCAK
jgi:hypothetical protein